jgi:chromosome segregation ATPase
VIDAPSEFELVEFEQVEPTPGTALLRITGRSGTEQNPVVSALLIADGGQAPHRVSPLPSPPGPPGTVRIAFSAPLDVVRRGTKFALELLDGSVIRLPAPSKHRPPRNHDGLAAEAERHRLADAERLRALEIERRRAVESERQRSVESDRLRTERDQALTDRNRALLERNHALSDRDDAESRARAAAAGLGAVEAQARSANETAARLQIELDEAQEETHNQRREVVELSELIARVRAELDAMRDEADTVRTDNEQAKRRIAELTRAFERSEERESVATAEIELLKGRLAERAEQEADSERLQVLEEALVVRDAEVELLNATVSDLLDHYEEHADARERAAAQVEMLEGERAQLAEEHERLTGEYAQLADERAGLLEEHGRTLDDQGRLLSERAGLQASADELFAQLEEARTSSMAELDLLRDALLEQRSGD